MKIKVLKQRDASACGPTVIKMSTDYFGLNFSQKKINEVSRYKELDGMSNEDIVKTLEILGLSAQEKKGTSWEELIQLNTEKNVLIVSWMLKGYIGHVSVVEKVTKDAIFLAEPTEGRIIKMNKVIFMRLWFDYDDMWWPEKNSDIQMRWIAVVSKK